MDWDAIKAFYLDCRSLKATAEHFGVSLEALKKRAQRQRWRDIEGTSQSAEGTNVPPTTGTEGTSDNGNVPSMSPDATADVPSTCANVPSRVPSAAADVPSIFIGEVTTYPNAMSPGSPAVDTIASVLDAIQVGQFRAFAEIELCAGWA